MYTILGVKILSVTLAQVSFQVPRLLCQHQVIILAVRLPSYLNLAIDIDAIGIWLPAGIVATLSNGV